VDVRNLKARTVNSQMNLPTTSSGNFGPSTDGSKPLQKPILAELEV